MDNKLIKRLLNAFKLSGFNIRREFCELILQRFYAEHMDLQNKDVFDQCIRNISSSLEKQNLCDKSIERANIERAIEMCLNAGCDKHETVFNIINAFAFPKLYYDIDRKRYFLNRKKPKMLSDPSSKTALFLERYYSVLQRTQRNFKNKLGEDTLELCTVDYLLTLSHCTLDKKLILGCLLMVTEGKYHLEDPTGIVELDLSHAKYHGGFFVENCFVLVNGVYDDKKLTVSTMIMPPGEEYENSKTTFGNLNYFGGESQALLRESTSLKNHLNSNPSEMFFIFSDIWLDHPQVFEKLEVLFKGMMENPPIGFIFMGNFMSESHGSERIDVLKKLFKQFEELISKFTSLVENCHFVFVPGMLDPCNPHIVPRLPLPTSITGEFTKTIPKTVFATNPCRLQYCNKEIVLFRADMLVKLMQATIHKPTKEEINHYITRTIISQGHLSPISLNALTVHWDFDYTLRLYPLPNLVVIGDKSEMYKGEYMGCQVVNPGSFCDSGFQFMCYTPALDAIDECVI